MIRKTGMTLNELLIAMFISTVVLLSIFALYFLGIRIFVDGRKEFEMQKAVRDAFEMITREARWAEEIQLISIGHIYDSSDEGFKFITIDSSKIQIFTYESGAKTKVNDITEPVIERVKFQIDVSESLLTIIIESKNENINIETSVKLFGNIGAGPIAGVGIKYK